MCVECGRRRDEGERTRREERIEGRDDRDGAGRETAARDCEARAQIINLRVERGSLRAQGVGACAPVVFGLRRFCFVSARDLAERLQLFICAARFEFGHGRQAEFFAALGGSTLTLKACAAQGFEFAVGQSARGRGHVARLHSRCVRLRRRRTAQKAAG